MISAAALSQFLLSASLSSDPWKVAEAINLILRTRGARNWSCDVDGPDHQLELWLVCDDGYEQRLGFDDCVEVGEDLLSQSECWPKESIGRVMGKVAA